MLIRNVAIQNIPNQNDSIYGTFPLIAAKFNDYYQLDDLWEYVHRDKAQYFIFKVQDPADANFVGHKDGYNTKLDTGMLAEIRNTYKWQVYFNYSIHQPYCRMRYAPAFDVANGSINHDLF